MEKVGKNVLGRSPSARKVQPPSGKIGAFVGLIVAIGLVLVITGPAQGLSVLVSPGADLPTGRTRIHPDTSLGLSGNYTFNVYTDNTWPDEWVWQRSLTATRSNADLKVTFYSEVYKHKTEGHTLFRYQIENTAESTTVIRNGNIAGFNSGWEFIDSGIIDLGGDQEWDQGDILSIGKSIALGKAQLDFAFRAWGGGGFVNKLLGPGEKSQWFYVVTDAPSWSIGQATVQNTNSSVSPIPVLVPVPEPLTILTVFASIAGLTGYVYRKRRSN